MNIQIFGTKKNFDREVYQKYTSDFEEWNE